MNETDISKTDLFDMGLVIPYKDTKPRFLLELINTITMQPCQPSYVIIVNDFSSKENEAWLREVVEQFKEQLRGSIVLLDTEEDIPGAAPAFNRGLEFSFINGLKFTKFMGADDLFIPGYFAVMKDAAKRFKNKSNQSAIRCRMPFLFDNWAKLEKDGKAFGEPLYETKKLYHFKYPEGLEQHVGVPVLEAFSKKYGIASIDFQGEIYRMHDNNISHTASGDLKGETNWRKSYEEWKKRTGRSIIRSIEAARL